MEQKPICFKSGERFLGRNSQILHHSPKVPELYTKEVNLIKNINKKLKTPFSQLLSDLQVVSFV